MNHEGATMQTIDEVREHCRSVGESIKVNKNDFWIDWACAQNPL